MAEVDLDIQKRRLVYLEEWAVELTSETITMSRDDFLVVIRASLSAVRQEASPDDIRAKGWYVAVHNDYEQPDGRCTFWLFTNPATGRFVKGEGATDAQALWHVRAALADQPAEEGPEGQNGLDVLCECGHAKRFHALRGFGHFDCDHCRCDKFDLPIPEPAEEGRQQG